jgi:hypothetical protein
MFQIETALLKFDDMSESSDKTSVVKRYISILMTQYLKLMIQKKQPLLRENSSTPDRC